MKKLKKIRNKRLGQSSIEFLFTLLLFFSMLVLSVFAVHALAVHHFMSYVAFMGARSYQSGASQPQEQREAAERTVAGYGVRVGADLFGAKIQNISFPEPVEGRPHAGGISEVVENSEKGVVISYAIPFVGIPIGPEMKKILNLTVSASSYLGREVTSDECNKFFEKKYDQVMGDAGLFSDSDQNAQGMEDSGC